MLRSFSRALSSSAGLTARTGTAIPPLRASSQRILPAHVADSSLILKNARPAGMLALSPKTWLTTTRAAATESMQAEKPQEPLTKYRKDYTPTPYNIVSVELDFVLNEDVSLVHSVLNMEPRSKGAPLVLDGRKDVKLVSIKVDGVELPSSSFTVGDKNLTIHGLPTKEFKLQITTEIKPQENSSLEGLYKSGGNYTTQCEAEGFRGITYFLDRPDVMATYTTRIEADKTKYPTLLGNGNLTSSGDLEGGRHYAVWEDPWPKPCYLFALVAGKLSMKERMFKSMSGRDIALRVFTNESNIDKVDFALESLAKSMKWDEEVFGLEYDLDLFNIVAVDDFNAGAMENKSLNIFNSRLVLASPETATDGDYARIESVVGHEYFHNWTGNRVTCRDWFQLTLKEGLTVFRDQEFSADLNSRPVKRIEDVTMLRASQFAEDGGPMAHPIRPDSYIKMDNFYTVTVYEKGAEVVRMYNTLLGKEGFRKGMDLYFKRHDGQAVTCDDFLAAMADANGEDLSQLSGWYSQAGTPHVEVSTVYDAAAKTFTLNCKQHTPPSPGQDTKEPLLIPISVGLLGPDGKDMPLKLQGNNNDLGTTAMLRLTQAEQSFTFTDIPTEPVPSVLRGFSAPVKLKVVDQPDEQLLFLFANDSDSFNRWESGQRLAKKLLLSLYHAAGDASKGSNVTERILAAGGVSSSLVNAFKSVLTDESVDGMFKAMAVTMPSSSELLDSIPEADPTLLHAVRTEVTKCIAASLRTELEAIVKANQDPAGTPYVFESKACGRRALKNKALILLSMLEQPEITADILSRFRSASNMTDEISALSALVEIGGTEREVALNEFYEKYKNEPLVILKWLGLQSGSNAVGNLALVKSLMDHPAFNIKNPNNCYTLFLGFARSAVNFHNADGSGYKFMADAILQVDKINGMVASRMMGAFTQWRKFDTSRQALMKAEVERILATEGLSENVFEIATKTLA